MQVQGFRHLLKRAQRGDPDALEKLLETSRPYLARVASGYADPFHAGESVSDLRQEAEIRAWQGLPTFEGGAGDRETEARFRTWLAQIVRRLAIDRHRTRTARKRQPETGRVRSLSPPARRAGDHASPAADHDPPAPGPTPSTAARDDERTGIIRRALDRIPDPVDQEIIRLYFFEQRSLPAIARRLGWTHDRVRDRYRKSIRRLERHLRPLDPGSRESG